MNTLRQIGEFLGDRFARMERLFARKEEVDTVRDDLAAHGGDVAIHRTSAEIRSEITDADLPATLARHVDVDGSIASHDAHAGAHPAIRDVLENLETHAGEVDGTLAAHAALLSGKLDTTGDGRDVTVAFAEASAKENIASGERLSVLFGKIARWFSNFGSLAFKDRIAKSDLGDALASELDGKVGKEAGKGLSSADFTHAEKDKLSGIAAGANTYEHPASHSASMIEPAADRLFVTPAEKIIWNGKADLDGTGKVPASQLPSYVDDVLTHTALAFFPGVGEDGKIYIAADTNRQYRWSGIAYVEISASLALGETPSAAYRGDRGKVAYDTALASKSAIEGLQSSLGGKLSAAGDGSGLGVNFSEPVVRENIASGENLSVLFGKIRKWFSSLGSLAFKNTVAIGDVDGLQPELNKRITTGDSRLSDARPAADVHPWAKAANKPEYHFGELASGYYGESSSKIRKDMIVSLKAEMGYVQRIALGQSREPGGWGNGMLSVGIDDAGTQFVDFEFDPNGRIISPAGTFAVTTDIPPRLPADGGNADTVGGIPAYTLLKHVGFTSNLDTINGNVIAGWADLVVGNPDYPFGSLIQWGNIADAVPGSNWINQLAGTTGDRLLFRTRTNEMNWSGWKTMAYLTDFPSSLPADGGDADTVDGLHAAPAGQVEPGKLASYDGHGYLNATVFADNWPVEDTPAINSIVYKIKGDNYYRSCSVGRLREVLNTGDQVVAGNLVLNTANGSYIYISRNGATKGHIGLGEPNNTDIQIRNYTKGSELRVADDGRNYSNGKEIATVDRLPVVVKSSAEPSGAFKDGDIWIQP